MREQIAGVENAGVSRMERHSEIILRKLQFMQNARGYRNTYIRMELENVGAYRKAYMNKSGKCRSLSGVIFGPVGTICLVEYANSESCPLIYLQFI